ncbi:MAG: THUMP domain-containing protein [Acidilobaceae archaeon]
MHSFNLIVTHLPGPHNKRRSREILEQLLDVEILESRPSVLICRVPEPLQAVEVLRRNLPPKSPILRVIPVIAVTRPRLDEVKRAVLEAIASQPEGSFAVRVDGRFWSSSGEPLSRLDVVKAIAEDIDRRVDLRNPDVLVYVKIVRFRGRRWAAVYVGKPDYILSTVKLAGDRSSL